MDIRLALDAANAGDSGQFKTIINTFKPNIDTTNIFTHQVYPNLIRSCCRIAFEPEQEKPWPIFYKPIGSKVTLLRLVPNPATNQVQLIWKGEEARFEVCFDMLYTVVANDWVQYSEMRYHLNYI